MGKPQFAKIKIAMEFIAQDRHNLSDKMLRARLGAYEIAV